MHLPEDEGVELQKKFIRLNSGKKMRLGACLLSICKTPEYEDTKEGGDGVESYCVGGGVFWGEGILCGQEVNINTQNTDI